MSCIKKRSSHALLHAAKKMIRDAEEGPQIIRTSNLKYESVNIKEIGKLSPKKFKAWWITSAGAKRKASNILLHYMKHKFNLDIATDYRTLLKTPKNPIPKVITPGSYIHLGVRKALHQLILEAEATPPASFLANILMQFFVDGLSISKSTKDGFWIIMMNIRHELIKRLIPKVIGVCYGKKKMGNFNDFLWASVMEVNDILEKGLID